MFRRLASWTFALCVLGFHIPASYAAAARVQLHAQMESDGGRPPGVFRLNLLYVANSAANSITAYLLSGTAAPRPVSILAGPKTGLASPMGITFDDWGEMYVVNGGNSSVTVYAPRAAGNVAPRRTLAGPDTGISSGKGYFFTAGSFGPIAVDSRHGHLFVSTISASQVPPYQNPVLVFPLDAHGDRAPITSLGNGNESFYAGEIEDTAPGVAMYAHESTILVATNYNECCHLDDGWIYYDAATLVPITSLAYYINAGIGGLSVLPNTQSIISLYGLSISPGAAEIDVWPPFSHGDANCGTGCIAPAHSLYPPSNQGFRTAAGDGDGDIWALTSAGELEEFVPNVPTPKMALTGLTGASALTIEPPFIGGPKPYRMSP